jgi:hypothetical protein
MHERKKINIWTGSSFIIFITYLIFLVSDCYYIRTSFICRQFFFFRTF